MGLIGDSGSYVGRALLFEPFYGWGWSSLDPDMPELTYEESGGPAPFHATVESFFGDDGGMLGGTALIEEPAHSHHGCYVVFSVRHVEDCDFRTRIGDYSMAVGPELIAGGRPTVGGSGAIAGFGRVRDER